MCLKTSRQFKCIRNQASKLDNNGGKREHAAGSKVEREREEMEEEDGSGWEFVL